MPLTFDSHEIRILLINDQLWFALTGMSCVLECRQQVRIAIDAPNGVAIYREETFNRIQKQ
jgi:sRNA-binding carbon storage regulator CsrA